MTKSNTVQKPELLSELTSDLVDILGMLDTNDMVFIVICMALWTFSKSIRIKLSVKI
ncbi:hypothetical protein [Moritella marina]|uniref:hypothetical protein n=1 Tax=Moritella marina TaxID=90736 RepID=UPI00030B3F09|nr:hypothetical protein [Moritella marina]